MCSLLLSVAIPKKLPFIFTTKALRRHFPLNNVFYDKLEFGTFLAGAYRGTAKTANHVLFKLFSIIFDEFV